MGQRQIKKFSWGKMADEMRNALLKTCEKIRADQAAKPYAQ